MNHHPGLRLCRELGSSPSVSYPRLSALGMRFGGNARTTRPREEPRKLWIYDLRTNMHFTLKEKAIIYVTNPRHAIC